MRKRATAAPSTPDAARVGSAELRANLAKYVELAKAGRRVIVQERGKGAYVISRYEEPAPPSVFGCLRERTDYVRGAVVNAKEAWPPGELP